MYKLHFLALLLVIAGCNSEQTTRETKPSYNRYVGDINFDSSTDDADFLVCNGDENVIQYFNSGNGLQYKGEKIAIYEAFNKSYEPVDTDESGWVRVRFIVNCEGKTGRFRLLSSDFNYQEKTFDSEITDQLLSIAQKLTGWRALPGKQGGLDYYQYLTFKIEKGHIIEILP
ncbi:hypothetical protein E1176_05020 [Fulvivirga sp. RKSG066]|uniref:hypothetical protein n=1 Tax=Fulvivirga aurantia TaxID=2529383 RepID=UPI0012BD0B98|nr:hypothetical protein [Fulvivirga aurantia]MTI20377.1 hypothetical protein [Fulvivirga aurantia]